MDGLDEVNSEQLSLEVIQRKQQIEESALIGLNRALEKVYKRFEPEIQTENPDLSQRPVMAAAVLAMMKCAPTFRDAREGMKQLQGIFGHSVQKVETHNHLTLDARVAAGIQEAERLGLLRADVRVIEAEVQSCEAEEDRNRTDPVPRDPQPAADQGGGVRPGTPRTGDPVQVPELDPRLPECDGAEDRQPGRD